MARNPNPTRIADPTWRVWEETSADTPGVRFGGIYAPKPYYHSSVEENLAKWAPNYSIRVWLDLNRGNRKFARAIDWTMSTTEMKKRTGYLRRSALDRRDNRPRAMREFYGTLDGRTVFGLSKDDEDGPWKFATSDSSHLWHIHGAIFAAFVNDWAALEGIASVWSGESWEAWAKRKWGSAPTLPISGIPEPILREGAEGPAVLALQVYLNGTINAGLAEDADFGPATTAAVRELQRRARITTTGIYDHTTATALRDLLEDDMDLTDKLPVTPYTKDTWNRLTLDVQTALSHGYTYSRSASDRGLQVLTEQAKQTALLQQIAAGQSGLTEAKIAAAVAEGVRQVIPSPEELAAAVAAAVDHDLDTAAVTAALREVLGSLDGAGA